MDHKPPEKTLDVLPAPSTEGQEAGQYLDIPMRITRFEPPPEPPTEGEDKYLTIPELITLRDPPLYWSTRLASETKPMQDASCDTKSSTTSASTPLRQRIKDRFWTRLWRRKESVR